MANTADGAAGATSPRWSIAWPVGGYLGGNVIAAILVVPLWVVFFGDDGIVPILMGSIGLWFGFVGAPILASRFEGTGDVVEDFGLRFERRDIPLGLLSGIGLQLVVLPLLYAAIQLVSGPLDVEGPASDLASKASMPVAWIAFALVVGIGAPITEELFFRGLLYSTVQTRLGSVAGVVISSALFASTHFQLVQFVGLFVAAATWSTLTARTGRLGPAIFSHIGFNMSTVVALWLSR